MWSSVNYQSLSTCRTQQRAGSALLNSNKIPSRAVSCHSDGKCPHLTDPPQQALGKGLKIKMSFLQLNTHLELHANQFTSQTKSCFSGLVSQTKQEPQTKVTCLTQLWYTGKLHIQMLITNTFTTYRSHREFWRQDEGYIYNFPALGPLAGRDNFCHVPSQFLLGNWSIL